MIVEAKNMKTEELIGALVELDKQGKENRALTNAYKAELQARGISIMDDHNVKYVKFYGDAGSAAITDSMSLDILNPDKLKKLIGEGVWNTKVKESTETKYKYDGKFEKMLKKLKGDFEKDKDTLTSVLLGGVKDGESAPDFDVELWYIYRIKNAELIRAFLPEELIDNTINEIRKCILVETKTSITLDYKEEE